MIDLALAKMQQRIDGTEEDELCRLLLDAAVEDCKAYLNRPLYEDEAEKEEAEAAGETDGIIINAPIRAAMLQMFGSLYAHREGGTTAMPESVRRILDKYRRISGV